jgi:hypothetical protein
VTLRLKGVVRHNRIRGSFTFTVNSVEGEQLDAGSGTFNGRRIEA